jgi:beta-N-acetylhexosaminidase
MSLSQQPRGEPSLTQPSGSKPARASFPSSPDVTRAQRGASRGSRKPLAVALAMLAVLAILGSLIGQHLLSSGGRQVSQAASTPLLASGPFIGPPLNARQVDELMNLKSHMQYRALASLYVAHLSLDEEIGQLIMLEYNQPYYSSDLDYAINTLHVGGVIMYALQLTSFHQAKTDIAQMQSRAKIPLLISTDEEGGPYVERLGSIYGPRMSATDIFQTGKPAVAAQQGLKTSRDLAALGINADLAPDVDVNQVNGYDMVTRTFGTTPAQVITFAGPYLRAMQANGTIACLKHFPGLGAASPDAHTTLPVVTSSRSQIYATDLAPFKAFIQSPDRLLNPGMIMPTDVLMPAIDPVYPAELSHIFMTDILRRQFGYDGVVLTDALYMQGVAQKWDRFTAAVMALQVGNDMILGPNGSDQTILTINAIKAALQSGQLSKARLDEAATRIIALKMQYHLMPLYTPAS